MFPVLTQDFGQQKFKGDSSMGTIMVTQQLQMEDMRTKLVTRYGKSLKCSEDYVKM